MALLVRVGTDADIAAGDLWAAGAVAVVEDRHGLTAGFADDAAARQAATALAGSYAVELVEAPDRQDAAWVDRLSPVHAGRLTVRASTAGAAPGPAEIVIDPGTAFGHGGHPSTRLVLEALDRRVRPGMRVLDFGTGTGVVAIGALVLGAAAVTAVDVAADARRLAHANALHNGVADRLDIVDAPGDGRRFDLVCANLTIDMHERVAADLCPRVEPAGTIVISGVLEAQADRALAAYAPLTEAGRSARDGWIGFELSPATGR